MMGIPAGDLRQMEEVLAKRLLEAETTEREHLLAKRCFLTLGQVVQQLGPGWSVKPFGSLLNGFATLGSDLDVCCCKDVDSEQGVRDGPSPAQALNLVLPLLNRSGLFSVVDVIRSASVPILKVRFQGSLDVDLSFQNQGPLRNTQLLQAYSQLDPCVRALVVSVKLWAKAAGVCGAANGHLSAYSLTLMAIYFLQVDPELALPCLPTRRTGLPRQAGHVAWSCRAARSDLLYRFLYFFTSEFVWGSEVVSIRLGARAAATDPVFSDLQNSLMHRLHIEDPFQINRNLHCVLGLQNETTLYQKMWEALQTMQCGRLPAGLWTETSPSMALVEDRVAAKQRQLVGGVERVRLLRDAQSLGTEPPGLCPPAAASLLGSGWTGPPLRALDSDSCAADRPAAPALAPDGSKSQLTFPPPPSKRQMKSTSTTVAEDSRRPGWSSERKVPAVQYDIPISEASRSNMTTVMLRNIPCSFRRCDIVVLLEEADIKKAYDWMHVPLSPGKKKRSNWGYAFIDFKTPADAEECFLRLNGRCIGGGGAKDKVLEVTWANSQKEKRPNGQPSQESHWLRQQQADADAADVEGSQDEEGTAAAVDEAHEAQADALLSTEAPPPGEAQATPAQAMEKVVWSV